MYDIVIVGLGPAGSMLGQLLDKKYKVLALDKKSSIPDEKSFMKPCGGLLAPDAQKVLAGFNLTLPVDVLANPQIFSVRTIDIPRGKTRYYQRFYLNLNRHKFDLWLKSLVAPHIEVIHEATVSNLKKVEAGYEITYSVSGREEKVLTKYVVGADGAKSNVAKKMNLRKNIPTYISIQEWYKDTHHTPFYSCLFDNDITDCYSWGLSKDDYFILGGAFPVDNARQRFEALKEKSKQFGFSYGDVVKTEVCQVLRPRGVRDCFSGKENVFLIGEAAGFISPSSLEGISYALKSAHILSKVLNGDATDFNRAYHRKTRLLRGKIFSKNMKVPFMYTKPLRYFVMKSGMNTIDVIEK